MAKLFGYRPEGCSAATDASIGKALVLKQLIKKNHKKEMLLFLLFS
jgi:hypothetical protein